MVTTRNKGHTLLNHISYRGRDLSPYVKNLNYDSLLKAKSVRAGTYIFSDLERLSSHELIAAASVADKLLHDPEARILNHPALSMRRYEILRTLGSLGYNKFDIYRLSEAREPTQYPVFLRRHDDHTGAGSELLYSRQEMLAAIKRLEDSRIDRDQWIICEFCDTADENGIYRKYSAFNLDGQIVPRHLFFSHEWMLKVPTLVDSDHVAEEWQYVTENPHEEALREIFALARIDYGRIDYALLDGRIQVWEINTNPVITTPRDGGGPARWPVHDQFSRQFSRALLRLDQSGSRRTISLTEPVALRTRCRRILRRGWHWLKRRDRR